MRHNSYNEKLKNLINQYVHKAYDYGVNFPKDEVFELTSQFKRSAISVALDYVEKCARRIKFVFKNFIEISYGSLKESVYLFEFSYNRKHSNINQYKELNLAEEIAKMLWGIMGKLD